MSSSGLLTSKDVAVRRLRIPGRRAAMTLDLESDFATDSFEGIKRISEVCAVFEAENVPLTVFAEARVLERFPEAMRDMAKSGHDVQLHCRDHTAGNDTPETLGQSVRIYERVMKRAAAGYRANTYQLTARLLNALINLGFRWDSSILAAPVGNGANGHRTWREAPAFMLADRLYEIPVTSYAPLPLPTCQAYRNLMDRMLPGSSRLLRYPRVCIHNMHLVDLIRLTPALRHSPLTALEKRIYAFIWHKQDNMFGHVRSMLRTMRSRGYVFHTMTELTELTGEAA